MNWEIHDRGHVLFTDEPRFCLVSSDYRPRVYRRPNERYFACNIQETTLYRGGSVMVLGEISLTVDCGCLTSQQYKAEILEPFVVPFAQYIGDGSLLMKDNVRPHAAHIVTKYLSDVNIQVLEWPAGSPYMNPMGHLWDIMGRWFRSQHPPPNSFDKLQPKLSMCGKKSLKKQLDL